MCIKVIVELIKYQYIIISLFDIEWPILFSLFNRNFNQESISITKMVVVKNQDYSKNMHPSTIYVPME